MDGTDLEVRNLPRVQEKLGIVAGADVPAGGTTGQVLAKARSVPRSEQAHAMSDEAPRVDCHECKDLEFARNLAAQMRDGYGRHNSNRAFWDAPRPRRAALTPYQEASGARVIGRIGDRVIRERPQDCGVGDAVPEANMPGVVGNYAAVLRKAQAIFSPCGATPPVLYDDVMHFERVRVQMRDGAGVWSEHCFWKRLS